VKLYRLIHFLAGAAAVSAIAFAATEKNGARFIAGIEQAAKDSRDSAGGESVRLKFATDSGWLTRHPALSGGRSLSDAVRVRAAVAIAETPGVGGVHWVGRRHRGPGGEVEAPQFVSLHCQDDVEAILRVRSIRFREASARIDRASQRVLDEVATALLPCLGSIIAITGHTDSNGDTEANLALSIARAEAVRWALIGRGIPADGLRAAGLGSSKPLEGLAPEDSANRRIEFSVIETMPLQPTPIDVPGPG